MDQSSVQFTDTVGGNDHNSYRYGADRISNHQRQYAYRNPCNASWSNLSGHATRHRSSGGPNDFSFAASDPNPARKLNRLEDILVDPPTLFHRSSNGWR